VINGIDIEALLDGEQVKPALVVVGW